MEITKASFSWNPEHVVEEPEQLQSLMAVLAEGRKVPANDSISKGSVTLEYEGGSLDLRLLAPRNKERAEFV